MSSKIVILNPYLTIAGQTAPGDGIAIKDGHFSVRASEVIFRYIRIRPGPACLVYRNENANGIEVRGNISNIVVDHVSLSWGTDDLLSTVYGAKDITFQWNVLGEALDCGNGVPYCSGKGMLLAWNSGRISAHHNLFVNTYQRQPAISSGDIDFVNNVSYNNNLQASEVAPIDYPNGNVVRVNFVGNYYKVGPNSRTPAHSRDQSIVLWSAQNANSAQSGAYLFGNIGPTRPNDTMDQRLIAYQDNGGLAVPAQRFNFPPVTTTDAFTALNQVLARAGTTVPARDAVDRRLVNYVATGTSPAPAPPGGINYPQDVGGWPVLATGTPPPDSDRDGMPDAWESAHGFNPSNASDGPLDADGDGYTNVEEYINSISGM